MLKKESEIVQSTSMLHPTRMRRKAHKRVRRRFPVKDSAILKVSTNRVTKIAVAEQAQEATWKRIVRRRRLYREQLIHYRLYV